jgi:hypothetical protein
LIAVAPGRVVKVLDKGADIVVAVERDSSSAEIVNMLLELREIPCLLQIDIIVKMRRLLSQVSN